MRVITEQGGLGCEQMELKPEIIDPAPRPGALHIVVPDGGLELTRAAVDAVAWLARSLQTGATLVSVQVVPYSLPLDSPPISSRFYRRCLDEVVSRLPLPLRVELLLARDQECALRKFMPQSSLILIVARPRRWWRKSAEEKLACALRRAGHKVALVTI